MVVKIIKHIIRALFWLATLPIRLFSVFFLTIGFLLMFLHEWSCGGNVSWSDFDMLKEMLHDVLIKGHLFPL